MKIVAALTMAALASAVKIDAHRDFVQNKSDMNKAQYIIRVFKKEQEFPIEDAIVLKVHELAKEVFGKGLVDLDENCTYWGLYGCESYQ